MIAVTDGVTKNRLLTWLAGRYRSIAYSSMNVPIEFTSTSQAMAPANGSGSVTRGCSMSSVITASTGTLTSSCVAVPVRRSICPQNRCWYSSPRLAPASPTAAGIRAAATPACSSSRPATASTTPAAPSPKPRRCTARVRSASSSQATSAVSTGVMPWISAVSAAGRPSAIAQ